ncbi:primosomal protein N' [Sanguibacter suaedae]|uniref:Probable replication restart protein PriA n=1 Tax=Sanguibacter suaedae TaxID=2795737 RepID=A0A934I6Z1_9MICO|nr:primosomal protein N' [Sanguibacter suaedae]MBI9115381.1 primosomal protein N' [Sanguibacter suaedae]
MTAQGPEQPTLPGLPPPAVRARAAGVRARTSETGQPLAEDLPIARVCVDVPPAHLDRLFDYTVPQSMAAEAVPGVRVKVRFGAQDVDGYVIERVAATDHEGRLVALRKIVSPQPVLTPEVAGLARRVADYYAGSMTDVLRLAVPPRLARVETEEPVAAPAPPATGTVTEELVAAWSDVRGGEAYLRRLAAGESPRAVWSALPASRERGGWPAALAAAASAVLRSGRGALLVVPDARDVELLAEALVAVGVAEWSREGATSAPGLGPAASFVRLTADAGPTPRYRSFLAALRGGARVVVGTRAAAFAPVADLGLVVCWDDVDPMHQERRAPYPHVREVLALRSEQTGCAVLVGSVSRSIHAQALVESGWARELVADRATVRARTPRVQALTSVEVAREGAAGAARLPGAAWQAMTAGLRDGPVLVQVPRAGYLPVVACVRCREAARCGVCTGPLSLTGARATPQCAWCGALAGGWSCPECSATGLRSVRVGSDRTAEELGRAFPGVPVRSSGARSAAGVLASVPSSPALVVATPGAEPVVEGGYSVGVLLDAAVSTNHVGLYTDQEALHRWLSAAALVRPSTEGGRVLLVGDAAPIPTNALVRWDPVGMASRELDERVELSLPPAARIASVSGDRHAVDAFLARLHLPEGGSVLGPVDVDPDQVPRDGAPGSTRRSVARTTGTLEAPVRAVVRVPVGRGRELARAMAGVLAVASAKRETGLVSVVLDPKEMV